MSLLYLFHRIIIKHNTDFSHSAIWLQEISHVSFFSLQSFKQNLSYLKIKFNYEVIIFLQNVICGRNLSLAKICSPAPARSLNMTAI